MVSTIILYFYLRSVLLSEVEEELRSTEARIESSLMQDGTVYQLPPVVEVNRVTQAGSEIVKDTLIFDPSQDELEEFRELSTFSKINGVDYKITVRALVVESENILIAVVASYLIIIFLVFIFLFYLNKSRNQKIWHPFFTNLEQMKKFSLSSDKPISLAESDILEFSDLNSEISILTDKVRSDYKNLKQYTEDVSHEMHTPLSIIQAKIENVINGDTLADSQYEQLTSIQKDIQRLTQMTRRLTLLTKIDNHQFAKTEQLDLVHLLEDTCSDFSEISTIALSLENKTPVWVKMDPYLASTLCNNLISNAIKYSADTRNIVITSQPNSISITNSGTKALQHPEKLFNRFYRESETPKSTGLGLAIVKRICDYYGFKILYDFIEGRHRFSIVFD